MAPRPKERSLSPPQPCHGKEQPHRHYTEFNLAANHRQQLDSSKIHRGRPLEFDLLDRNANLLLRKSAVIETEQIIERSQATGWNGMPRIVNR